MLSFSSQATNSRIHTEKEKLVRANAAHTPDVILLLLRQDKR